MTDAATEQEARYWAHLAEVARRPRLIRVSSRALGERRTLRCYVYPTLAEMIAAADRFNGGDHAGAWAVTQAWTDDEGRARVVVLRLAETHLSAEVVAHELHHVAAALYGSIVDSDCSVRDHLHHANEPFAYLFSDLFIRLARCLGMVE